LIYEEFFVMQKYHGCFTFIGFMPFSWEVDKYH